MAAVRGLYNAVFCYLPFVLEGAASTQDAYAQAKAAFRGSDAWNEVHDDARYLFRYICEKYDNTSPNCQCHHFVMDAEALAAQNLGPSHAWVPQNLWNRRQGCWHESADSNRTFIGQVHCYCFATSINVLVFKLHVEADDPYLIASRLFHLKNVRNGMLLPYELADGTEGAKKPRRSDARSMMSLAQEVLGSLAFGADPHLCFYANEGRERANILVHAEVDEEQQGSLDADRLLYYLANCYKDDYDYGCERSLPLGSYWASPSTTWGCSSESLACLTLPQRAEQGRGFLVSVFRHNILNEYHFLYLLLLHQKYAYYRLLMVIGAGQRRDRAQLEQFHRELEIFRANFVFARVSETQQYQTLYETVRAELRLEDMDRDVAEPIEALAQLRREDEERAERAGEQRVERAMNTVALLAGISAICDALDVINNYIGAPLPQTMRNVLSLASSVALLIVTLKAAHDLRRSDEE